MKEQESKNAVIEKIRMEILNAAIEIIIQKGYDALTMRGLSSKLGMTAPNIYNYFTNKEEIYLTLVIRGFEILKDSMEESCNISPEPLKKARAMVAAYMDFGSKYPWYYEIMFIRNTPRYNDFLGTPLEEQSNMEMDLSMKIVEMVLGTISEILFEHRKYNHELVEQRMILVWSILHGLLSLNMSRNMEYLLADPENEYNLLIDELFSEIIPYLI